MEDEIVRLRRQAAACRRVAGGHHDEHVVRKYSDLASHYEELALAVKEAEEQKERGSIH